MIWASIHVHCYFKELSSVLCILFGVFCISSPMCFLPHTDPEATATATPKRHAKQQALICGGFVTAAVVSSHHKARLEKRKSEEEEAPESPNGMPHCAEEQPPKNSEAQVATRERANNFFAHPVVSKTSLQGTPLYQKHRCT